MAPRRFKRSEVNVDNSEKYKDIGLSDVLCPICRSIFVEPVTLPCKHGFCLACFNGTMENTTLSCPLCRTRIGSWLRSARKENKVINVTLWNTIQNKFSKEIRKKIDGEDDVSIEKIPPVKLADPGEIRREYEIQLERERSELRKQQEAETKASELEIKKILEEELKAEKIAKEKLRLDEEIARRITEKASKSIPSCSQITPKPSKRSSIDKYLIALSKKKELDTNKMCKSETISTVNKKDTVNKSKSATTTKSSPQKGYTSTIMNQARKKNHKALVNINHLRVDRADSNGSDSGDSIKQEMRYFKPIRSAPKSIPKQRDGNIIRAPLLKIPPVIPNSACAPTHYIRCPATSLMTRIGSSHSAFAKCAMNKCSSSPTSTTTLTTTLTSTLTTPVPVQQPSIMTESGKVIKQYYNKKKTPTWTISKPEPEPEPEPEHRGRCRTPDTSPLLGFQHSNQIYTQRLRYIVDSLTDKLNALDSPVIQNNISTYLIQPNDITNKTTSAKISTTSLKLSGNESLVNGCTRDVVSLQEQLDLEFAKKLHEELNNPRGRITRRGNGKDKNCHTDTQLKTRSSPRKRQLTLDQLISPKKFKI